MKTSRQVSQDPRDVLAVAVQAAAGRRLGTVEVPRVASSFLGTYPEPLWQAAATDSAKRIREGPARSESGCSCDEKEEAMSAVEEYHFWALKILSLPQNIQSWSPNILCPWQRISGLLHSAPNILCSTPHKTHVHNHAGGSR